MDITYPNIVIPSILDNNIVASAIADYDTAANAQRAKQISEFISQHMNDVD